jgi:hypothetical protein
MPENPAQAIQNHCVTSQPAIDDIQFVQSLCHLLTGIAKVVHQFGLAGTGLEQTGSHE